MSNISLSLTAEAAAAIPAWLPPDGYTVRAFEHGDEEGIAALLWRCAPAFGGTHEAVAGKLNNVLGRPTVEESANIIVADEQAIVAFGTISKADQFGANLWGIAVHPDHRRRGLGAGICNVVIARLVELGYYLITVGTASGNLPARKLYEKLGFEYK